MRDEGGEEEKGKEGGEGGEVKGRGRGRTEEGEGRKVAGNTFAKRKIASQSTGKGTPCR